MKLIGIDIGTTTISGIVMEHNIGNNAELIEAKTITNDSFLPTANDWEKIQDAEQIINMCDHPIARSCFYLAFLLDFFNQ